MTFIYGYKTSKNERREGTIAARSREDVYAQLKRQGIRPYQVQLAPGLLNRLASFGKRGLAIFALSTVLLVMISYSLVGNSRPTSEPRSQIYGDPGVLQLCESSGWTNVFETAGECFLAGFAQPGYTLYSTNRLNDADIVAVLNRSVAICSTDSPEVAKMKRMVNWMKGELGRYIHDGGNVSAYVERLYERQREEIKIRERIANELKAAKAMPHVNYGQEWKTRNSYLRAMGLRTFPL